VSLSLLLPDTHVALRLYMRENMRVICRNAIGLMLFLQDKRAWASFASRDLQAGVRHRRVVPSSVPFGPSPVASPDRRCFAAAAKPKRGSVVDSYQTVSVNCAKCGERLFRYKKKNGTKSNLVKCFVERISEDCAGVLRDHGTSADPYSCPSCQTEFARSAIIRGLPALKLVGGKIRMTKK
jgi:hypothetical protein